MMLTRLMEACPEIAHDLKDIPAYDLTDVASLFVDYLRERERPIPRRPPHDMMWCEWQTDVGGDLGIVRYGCLIWRISDCEKTELLERLRATSINSLGRGMWVSEVLGWPDLNAWGIRRLMWSPCRCFLGQDAFAHFALMDGTFTKFRIGGLIEDADIRSLKTGNGLSDWFLPNIAVSMFIPPGPDDYGQERWPWPPFMAFMLLNCRNVTVETERTPPALAKARRRRGRFPLPERRVLKLLVPSGVSSGGSFDAPLGGCGPRRFHMCRGHFMDLAHERYVSRRLVWRTAHWRGDPEVGKIEKTYEIGSRRE